MRAHLRGPDGAWRCGEEAGDALHPPEGSVLWLDIEAPDSAELALLTEHFRFHPLAVEDCVHEQRRAKLERYPTHVFVVLCALDRVTRDDLLDTTPVCIFVRAQLVVTVHLRRVTAIESVSQLLVDDPSRVGNAVERVLHTLTDSVIDEFVPLLEDWEDRIDILAARAGHPGEEGLLDELVAIRRELLVTRRIMMPHADVLRRLVDDDSPEVTPDSRIYFRDVHDHALFVSDTIALLLEIANGAMSVQSNAVNERINEVMRFIAVMSALLLPWTVVSGIFGMNFDVIPLSHQPFGFAISLGVMLALTGMFFLYFKQRRWFPRIRPPDGE